MKTLTIDASGHQVLLTLKGLSFKAMSETYKVKSDLCICDSTRKYCFWLMNYDVDGRTAQVKTKYLIERLKEIHEVIPFDKIKLKRHYELTAEELMNEIINH